jgi:hypothetical protein
MEAAFAAEHQHAEPLIAKLKRAILSPKDSPLRNFTAVSAGSSVTAGERAHSTGPLWAVASHAVPNPNPNHALYEAVGSSSSFFASSVAEEGCCRLLVSVRVFGLSPNVGMELGVPSGMSLCTA